MTPTEFPFILSPSLGCPQIISLSKGESISVIVASKGANPRLEPSGTCFGEWSLIPSLSNQYEGLSPIPLVQTGLLEIPQDSAQLPVSIDDTREIISRELFINLLGGGVKIYKISLSLSQYNTEKVLRKVNGSSRPTLYDLCLEGPLSQRKPHAVCLTESKDKGIYFIHLTDLHLARRNDIIEREIATAIGPVKGFNNFNERMRRFIRTANEIADKGGLDLVLIGGDLVDFVNHGVSDEVIEADNNWQVFIEILTGGGCEPRKGNSGIRVPIFTSTGNHDWRLHPYDIVNASATFGIDKTQAGYFDFEYYDTMENLEKKKEDVYQRIVKRGSPISKENTLHAMLKWFLGYSETWQAKVLVPVVFAILSIFFPYVQNSSLGAAVTFVIAAGLHHAANSYLAGKVRYAVTHAVIPIEAGVNALHYYFLHVNPYFNHAFSFGSNYFIMMDTGPDCFTGQYLWDEGNKKMARMSIKDNIIGGSPDSMAFYPENEYYTCGQIVWLENVMKVIEREAGGQRKRIFICLHAPPINLKEIPTVLSDGGEVLLKEGEISIRYGTVNHFVSQFFHLCLGEKENDPAYVGPKVDIVFSGHAHQEVEFRIAHGPLIYCGRYSETTAQTDFNDKRPFVVQTSACGPLNVGYSNPPYFRKVIVNDRGEIIDFRV